MPTHHSDVAHHHLNDGQGQSPDDLASIRAILNFWFDRPNPVADWFGGAEKLDAQIKEKFFPLMEAAARGDCDSWQNSHDGALALIVLLDQFSRNIYRNTKLAFATDGRALEVALRAIAKGYDRKVPIDRQIFFYLPLEHDEDLRSQVACVALVTGLAARATAPAEHKMGQTFLEYALRHQATIVRFGRYPSRNAILGRVTTAQEAAFLKSCPSGF